MANPKLREVRAQPVLHRGQQGVLLSDPLGISQRGLFVPRALSPVLTLLDGSRDLGMVRTGFELRTGIPISTSIMEKLVSELDNALLLNNERFAQAHQVAIDDFRHAASRQPILIGKCYPEDPQEIRALLQRYLDQAEKDDPQTTGEVKGLISPHIDFARGGPIYARVWAKAASALEETELVVILGTDHNGGEGEITLTRQNYETPWGILPTARELVDEIARLAGEARVFGNELHHRGEHSVEAALIWLHYLLGNRRCDILPVLCGSFHSFIDQGESPLQGTSISATVEIIRKAATDRRTLIVAAADLAHIGPAFGDHLPLDLAGRARLAEQDQRLTDILRQGNAEAFFEEIRGEGDQRRICGMPPIYITLSVLSEVKGSLTGYAQCPASDDGTSLVSICGMVYHSQTC